MSRSTKSDAGVRAGRFGWLLWALVLVLVVTPRAVDLDIFYARDELTNWSWSDEFTQAVWRGSPAGTFTASNFPGIPLFWAQTIYFTAKYAVNLFGQPSASPADVLASDRSLPFLAERRLVIGLLVSSQIVAVVWLLRRLSGWWVALLAAILLGLDPFSLSEARVFRFEMVSALFACLSLLAYLGYFLRRRWPWLLLSGIMAGLAVSSKVSAGLIVPYIWLLLALDFLFQPSLPAWPQRFKQLLINGLVWAAGAVGIFWLVWPAMWVRPVEVIQYLFGRGLSQVSQSSVWHGPVFFWGRIFPEEDPGPFFYPVVFAFRTTPLVWAGLAGALALIGLLAWRRLARRHPSPLAVFGPAGRQLSLAGLPWPGVAGLLFLLFVLLVPAELSLSISKVDRYLVLVFPALNVLSAIGLAAGLNWLARLRSGSLDLSEGGRAVFAPPSGGTGGLFLAAILALQLGFTLPAHPYYYTYWNPLLGGGRAAMAALPVGSGEGVDLAMDYLNGLPGAEQASLVCGASQPWCEGKFKGTTLRSAAYADGEWVTADYVSLYISQLQRQDYPPEIVDFLEQQPPLHRVELNGATYMWVYKTPEIAHFAGRWNDLAGLGRLLGLNLEPSLPAGQEASQRQPGQALTATIWWTNLGAGVDNLVLRLVDETGYEWTRTMVVPRPEYAAVPSDRRAVVAGAAELVVPPGTPPGLYFLRLGVTAPGENRLLGEFEMPDRAGRLAVSPGPVFTDPDLFPMARRVNQALAPDISLLGYTPPAQVLSPAAPAWLALYWQAAAPPADYRVRLRLLDPAGLETARWEGRPGYDQYPMPTWRAGEIVVDVWALQAPPDVSTGRYQVELSLLDGSGRPVGAPVDLGPVEVWPQPVSYEIPPMQAELQAEFAGGLTLLGYDLYFDLDAAGGGRLAPVFYWQSRSDLAQSFDLELTLRAAGSGQVVKTWRLPLGGEPAKTAWKKGEVLTAIYELEDGPAPGAAYHLDLALVNRSRDQAEPANLADGSAAEFVRIENIQDKIVVRTAGE